MTSSSTLEFAVPMKCDSCANSVKAVLTNKPGIVVQDINIEQQRVVVSTNLNATEVQNALETVCDKAVLLGAGSISEVLSDNRTAGVAMIQGQKSQRGVIRMIQTAATRCLFDGTIDGLMSSTHFVTIHEFGDISDGCNSCGNMINGQSSVGVGTADWKKANGYVGEVEADSSGRISFRLESDRIVLADVIGQSVVLHEQTSNGIINRVACGIIARSSGLLQNSKRICTCDGLSIWDERDKAKAAEQINK